MIFFEGTYKWIVIYFFNFPLFRWLIKNIYLAHWNNFFFNITYLFRKLKKMTLSWNIRGLGSAEKRREVRLLVGEKVPWIVCLQETKLSAFDSSIVSSLWGNPSFNFYFRPSEGASGGLLIMWDTKEVEVWSSVSRTHFLLIHGRFVQSYEEFYLVNVYAPCGSRDKEALWASLSAQLLLLRGKRVCVRGF